MSAAVITSQRTGFFLESLSRAAFGWGSSPSFAKAMSGRRGARREMQHLKTPKPMPARHGTPVSNGEQLGGPLSHSNTQPFIDRQAFGLPVGFRSARWHLTCSRRREHDAQNAPQSPAG